MIPSRRVSFFGTGSDRLNDTVVNTVRHLFRRGWPRGFFLSGMLLPLLFGCIREDRSDCFPVAETRFVVLKIVDEATGQDITQTGEAGSAVLYLFSQGGRFVDRISVTRERIMKRAPIPLPDGTPGRCRAGLFNFQCPVNGTFHDWQILFQVEFQLLSDPLAQLAFLSHDLWIED